jgi:hypothetical protein
MFSPEIQAAIHAAVAAAVSALAAAPARTTSSPSSKIVLAKTPAVFDGSNKAEFETWLDALETYIGAYKSEFEATSTRIFFALSLLRREDGKPCPASIWARNYKKSEARKGPEHTSSWVGFLKELKGTFQDRNAVATAHARLTQTRQGKTPLADFLSAFELNAELAGYDHEEPNTERYLVEILKDLVADEVRVQLYAGGFDIPTRYGDLKRRLLTIAGNLEHMRAQNSRGTMFWSPAKPSAEKPKWSGAAPNLSKSTESGPVPMDVDRQRQKTRLFRCYNCSKEGHMAKDCTEPPRRKFNLRALCAEIDAEDKESPVLKQLAAKLREKGF